MSIQRRDCEDFISRLIRLALLTGVLIASGCGGDIGVSPVEPPTPVQPAQPGAVAPPSPLPSPIPLPSTSASPQVCTQVFVYGVTLQVVDTAGNPITSAMPVLTHGSTTENMPPLAGSPGTYVGAGESPGTYTAAVAAPGFAPQTLSGLQVNAGPCHVDPIQRTVVLNQISPIDVSG